MDDFKMNGSAVWKDAIALLKGNLEIATAIAGVFFFLPLLAFSWFLPTYDPPEDATSDQILSAAGHWFGEIWPYLLIVSLVGMLGSLAIYNAVLSRDKPTVAQALRTAAALFPVCFAAQWLSGLATLLGFLLLIIPGIYLSIKWMFVPVVIAAERETSAIEALRASWHLTKGNSVNIFFFVVVLAIAAAIVQGLLGLLIGLPFALLAEELGRFLGLFVDTALQTMTTVLFLFNYMAIYRQLSAREVVA